MSAGIKVITFAIILFFYNLVPWSFPHTWWAYVLCFIWIDFWRYWAHRIAHENRFWWATYVTHHNSEKYNWSVSFLLSWTQHIKIMARPSELATIKARYQAVNNSSQNSMQKSEAVERYPSDLPHTEG